MLNTVIPDSWNFLTAHEYILAYGNMHPSKFAPPLSANLLSANSARVGRRDGPPQPPQTPEALNYPLELIPDICGNFSTAIKAGESYGSVCYCNGKPASPTYAWYFAFDTVNARNEDDCTSFFNDTSRAQMNYDLGGDMFIWCGKTLALARGNIGSFDEHAFMRT